MRKTTIIRRETLFMHRCARCCVRRRHGTWRIAGSMSARILTWLRSPRITGLRLRAAGMHRRHARRRATMPAVATGESARTALLSWRFRLAGSPDRQPRHARARRAALALRRGRLRGRRQRSLRSWTGSHGKGCQRTMGRMVDYGHAATSLSIAEEALAVSLLKDLRAA